MTKTRRTSKITRTACWLKALAISNITEVFCTSIFGKNNVFKIFYNRILGLPIVSNIRKDRQSNITLPRTNKRILVRAMYSPTLPALRGIILSQGYQAVKWQLSVEQCRVQLYKAALDSVR